MFSFSGLRRSVRKVYLHNRVVCCLGHRDPKTYCFGQNLCPANSACPFSLQAQTKHIIKKKAPSFFQQIKVEKNLRPRLTKANHVEVEGKVDSSIHQ